MLEDILGFLLDLRDLFSSHVVFGVGVLLVGSFFLGSMAERFGLPSITGFILAGLLLGPSCLEFVHADLLSTLSSITEIALALIALVIGSEFSMAKLRTVGRSVFIITVFQMLATFLLVAGGLVLAGMQPPVAALLGAIASATAPAATVAIIRSLKARGSFVDHLYGVVALDDAGCVLLFAVVSAVAGSTLGMDQGAMTAVLHAILEIAGSLVIGAIAGWLLSLVTRRLGNPSEILVISLGIVLLLSAVSMKLGLSALLSCMAAGAVTANLSRRVHRMVGALDTIAPPLYAAFFAIAGTELDLSVLTSGRVLMLGGLFVLARAAGKVGGVWAGAHVARADPLIRRYLGLGMLPQAGVAIGLVLYLQTMPFFMVHHEVSSMLVNIVLFSVLFNELTGPPLSKYAVTRGALLD